MGTSGTEDGAGTVGSASPVVRIVASDGTTAGTGFLVVCPDLEDVALVVTCAHVVDDAGSGPGGKIRLCFRGRAGWLDCQCEAVVDPEWWRDQAREDVAFLRLPLPLPASAVASPLGLTVGATPGKSYATFGFPLVKPREGLPGTLDVTDRTTEGGFPVLAVRSNEISHGFSGAPVWDRTSGTVIGMVTSVIRANADPAGKQSEVAFVIPAETLIGVCPALGVARTCPYRGLNVFEEEDAENYFGREVATRTLLETLNSHDFVTVVGVSGSGKSSLVRAGLKKGLDEVSGTMLASMPRYRFRPGRQPTLDLVLSLGNHALGEPKWANAAFGRPVASPDREQRRLEAAEDLEVRRPQELAEAIARVVSSSGALVICDQFERLFTDCESNERRQHFIEVLIDLSRRGVKVVITLRADFYGAALQYPELARAMATGEFTLLPMTEEELLSTIEKPARRCNIALERGLAIQLVGQVAGRPGDLPLLEFALTQMWERDAENGLLTMATYQTIGGLRGALADHAERIWRTLATNADEAAARQTFLKLVTSGVGGERDGLFTGDAGRRAWLETELDAVEVAERFVHARLLTTGRDRITGQRTVELAHEALLRGWPRLRSWVRQDWAFIGWYDRDLAPYLRRWIQSERHRDLLLPPALLSDAARWLEGRPDMLSRPARNYVRASLRANAQRRRLRFAVAFAAVVVLIAVAVVFRFQRQSALDAAHVAQSRLVAVQAEASNDRELASLLATEAFKISPTLDAQSAIRTVATQQLSAPLNSVHGSVDDVAFSPDGRTLASVAYDGTLSLWDVASGRQIGAPIQGRSTMVSVAFSPTGRVIATGSEDGVVQVWDLGTHRQIGHPLTTQVDPGEPVSLSPVTSVAFSPDGRLLATGGQDYDVRVWDVATHREIGPPLRGHTDFVRSVAFSPRGGVLASGSDDGTIRLWDVATGHQIGGSLSGGAGQVTNVAFSPNGRWLASASGTSASGYVRLWNTATHRPIGLIDVTDPQALAFSTDTRVLAIAHGLDVGLWSTATDVQIGSDLTGAHLPLTSVAVSPNGRTLATGSYDPAASVRLWPVNSSREIGMPAYGDPNGIDEIAFSPDGRIAATASTSDTTVQLWDARTQQEITPSIRITPAWPPDQSGSSDGITSMAFSPNGRLLVFGMADNTIRFWDVTRHQQIGRAVGGEIGDMQSSVNSVAFSPNGRMLATLDENDLIRLWNVANHKQIGRPISTRGADARSMAFSPDGRTLATADGDWTVRLWSLATRRELGGPLTGSTGMVSSVAFSPDGRTLASSGEDSTVRFWDVAKRTQIGAPVTNSGGGTINDLAFSPDGSTLAGEADGITLWDVPSRRQVGQSLLGVVEAFSPDGKTLVTGDADGTVRFWTNYATAYYVHELCKNIDMTKARDLWRQVEPSIPYTPPCESQGDGG